MLASSESLPGIIDVIEIIEFEQLNIVNNSIKVKSQTVATNAKMHDLWCTLGQEMVDASGLDAEDRVQCLVCSFKKGCSITMGAKLNKHAENNKLRKISLTWV